MVINHVSKSWDDPLLQAVDLSNFHTVLLCHHKIRRLRVHQHFFATRNETKPTKTHEKRITFQLLHVLVRWLEKIQTYSPNGGAKWWFAMVESAKNHLKQTKKLNVLVFHGPDIFRFSISESRATMERKKQNKFGQNRRTNHSQVLILWLRDPEKGRLGEDPFLRVATYFEGQAARSASFGEGSGNTSNHQAHLFLLPLPLPYPGKNCGQRHRKSNFSYKTNQPIWQIFVKLDIFPKFRGENKKWLSCHHLGSL